MKFRKDRVTHYWTLPRFDVIELKRSDTVDHLKRETLERLLAMLTRLKLIGPDKYPDKNNDPGSTSGKPPRHHQPSKHPDRRRSH